MFEIFLLALAAFAIANQKKTKETGNFTRPEIPVTTHLQDQQITTIAEPEAKPIEIIFDATEADIQKNNELLYSPTATIEAPVTYVKDMQPDEQKKYYWDSDFLASVKPIEIKSDQFHPYLFLWTTNRNPYNGWGFVDYDTPDFDIPEFRKLRVQAYLYWLAATAEIMPFSEWKNVIHGSRQNLLINGKIAKYFLDRGTNMEAEIWNFEQAGGFGQIGLTERPPLEIGYGATNMPNDFVNRTGWMIFGIDYPREIKAKYAAFEVELAFQKGTVAAYVDQFKKPIYELYEEINSPINLTPLYGKELTYINRTLTPSFKSNETIFVEYLLKAFATESDLATYSATGGIFSRQLPAYLANQKKYGEAEGHNAYFKAILPERWQYVYKDTEAEKLARTLETQRIREESRARAEAELAAFTAAQKAATEGTLIADDVLELINSNLLWYFELPYPTTISRTQYPNPNERIYRFIREYVTPNFGTDQRAYLTWLKANARTFWKELKAWEAAGHPFTPQRMLSVDTASGLLTRESQWQDNFTLAFPTQSNLKIGRIYKADPQKIYIKDASGNILYTPEYYGNAWTRYQLQTDSKGTFYPIQNINP